VKDGVEGRVERGEWSGLCSETESGAQRGEWWVEWSAERSIKGRVELMGGVDRAVQREGLFLGLCPTPPSLTWHARPAEYQQRTSMLAMDHSDKMMQQLRYFLRWS
jgi:hypothetical protein